MSLRLPHYRDDIELVFSADADKSVYSHCGEWKQSCNEKQPCYHHAKTDYSSVYPTNYLIKSNQPYINFCVGLIQKYKPLTPPTFRSGSNRQTSFDDKNNAERNRTDLFAQSLPQIAKAIAEKSGKTTVVNCSTLGDIFRGFPKGTNFADNTYSQSKFKSFMDDSKFILIYTQLQETRENSTSNNIQYHFSDDRTDILDGLHRFLKANPKFIPFGITVYLHHNEGNGIDNFSEEEYTKPIQGQGCFDANYASNMIHLYNRSVDYINQLNNERKQQNQKPAFLNSLKFLESENGQATKSTLLNACTPNKEKIQPVPIPLCSVDKKSETNSIHSRYQVNSPIRNYAIVDSIKKSLHFDLISLLLKDNSIRLIHVTSSLSHQYMSDQQYSHEEIALLLQKMTIQQIAKSLDFFASVNPHLRPAINKLKDDLLVYQMHNLEKFYDWQSKLIHEKSPKQREPKEEKNGYSRLPSGDSKQDHPLTPTEKYYQKLCLSLKYIIFNTEWDLWMKNWGGGTEVRDPVTGRVNIVSTNMVKMLQKIQQKLAGIAVNEKIQQKLAGIAVNGKIPTWEAVYIEIWKIGNFAGMKHHDKRKPQVRSFFNSFQLGNLIDNNSKCQAYERESKMEIRKPL